MGTSDRVARYGYRYASFARTISNSRRRMPELRSITTSIKPAKIRILVTIPNSIPPRKKKHQGGNRRSRDIQSISKFRKTRDPRPKKTLLFRPLASTLTTTLNLDPKMAQISLVGRKAFRPEERLFNHNADEIHPGPDARFRDFHRRPTSQSRIHKFNHIIQNAKFNDSRSL